MFPYLDSYGGPIYFESFGSSWETGAFITNEGGGGNPRADFGSIGSWSTPASAGVPEINPATASGAVTMLSGLLLIVRGRRR